MVKIVGILGHGEIGGAIGKICREAGYKTLVRELDFDELKGKKVDYLHVNIPEKDNKEFVEIVSGSIKELKPKLTIINSSTTPGTTRRIYEMTKLPIVHSPVIGVHPHLYESIKNTFPKIIGPINKNSLILAQKHFKKLKLKTELYKKPEDSEAAKLLDLIYYAWNIVFCKWMKEVCDLNGFDFDKVYKRHNQIYNAGYQKLRPNVVRPILEPVDGPIGGHCTIQDTVLFDKYFKSRFTKFIINENKNYAKKMA